MAKDDTPTTTTSVRKSDTPAAETGESVRKSDTLEATTPKQPKRRRPYKLTKAKKQAFCSHLSRTGNYSEACRVISMSRRGVVEAAKADPHFAAEIEQARESLCDTLEAALAKRGTEGTRKGVWYRGMRVGEETVFSDTAAIFMLKGRRPEVFADRSHASNGATTIHDHRTQIVGLTDAQLEVIASRGLDDTKRLDQTLAAELAGPPEKKPKIAMRRIGDEVEVVDLSDEGLGRRHEPARVEDCPSTTPTECEWEDE